MSKFSFLKDKDKLLNTLARYDASSLGNGHDVEDVVDSAKTRKQDKHQHTFFIHVLLEQICETVEPEERKRAVLFDAVCRRLEGWNVMKFSLPVENVIPLRRKTAQKFLQFVKEVQCDVVPNPTKTEISIDSFLEDKKFSTKLQLQNRYEQNFTELKVIAEGGFGVVCKAEHKVDGNIYAVKKIIFKYKSDADYLKVIREAKSISTLNHLNVVSYNNAWMECLPTEGSNSPQKSESNSDSSDSESSDELSDSQTAKDTVSSSITEFSELFVSESIESLDTYISKNISHTSYSNQYESKTVYGNKCSISTDNSSSGPLTDSVGQVNSDYSKETEEKKELLKNVHNNEKKLTNFSNKGGKLNWIANSLNVKIMLCIQMEYCDCDLHHWLDERSWGKELPFEKDVTSIFNDIVNGVAHIHSKSIIHRDLKPHNIFYSKKYNVMKIGDFGLSTLVDFPTEDQIQTAIATSTKHSANLGTLPYAAPEQIKQNSYDSKVDIYSLGIMLIELLINFKSKTEFSKTIEEVKSGNIPNEIQQKWPEYVSLVRKLVKTDPKERMTAKEILDLPMFQDNLKTVEILEMKMALSEKEKAVAAREQAVLKRENAVSEKEKQVDSIIKFVLEEMAVLGKENEFDRKATLLERRLRDLKILTNRPL